MATKAEGCPSYDKAADDEPIFVLRAQDRLAPETIDHWVRLARERGVSAEKIAEAERCADAMAEWPNRKLPD